MNRFLPVVMVAWCVLASVFVACDRDQANDPLQAAQQAAQPQSAEGAVIPNQYIVLFREDVLPPVSSYLNYGAMRSREDKISQVAAAEPQVLSQIDHWLAKHDLSPTQVLHRYTIFQAGVALRLDAATYERIRYDDAIASLEHDREETLPPFQVESIETGGARAQTTPCGITNAGGAATAGTDRWIWVIDSGIDLDHPDLNVVTNTTYARSFVGGTADDCNGHGTHVAGTAAARNNTIGVIGVAAGAPVVPVRVFGCSGGSATSTIVAGINHVGAYDFAGDVANMSLGGYYGSNCASGSSYRSAVLGLANGGTRVAIASGNNFANAALYQPGCINGTNIFTVANMRCNLTYYNDPTYGSNYGRPPVDWIATGTSVYSTYLNGGYATLTGTSMATPHVAGIMQIRNAAPLSGGNVSFSGTSYPIARR